MLGGIASHLAGFRAGAQNRRTTQVKVYRESTQGITDGRGKTTFPRELVWEGLVEVRSYEPYERTSETAGAEKTIQQLHINFPVGAGPFEVGDIVDEESDRYGPPGPQASYRIAGLHRVSLQTGQRVRVDEILPKKK